MPSPEHYRNLELEAAAATSVARGSATLGRLVRFGVPLGALVFAGWLIFASVGPGPKPLTAPDPDEFTLRPYPAPTLDQPRPPGDGETIAVPPAPAPPEPEPPPPLPPAVVPPPPPEPPMTEDNPDDEEARRLAELERQRREEEERRRWERLRAPQVIADNASLEPSSDASVSDGAVGPSGEADDDPNRRFLAAVASSGVEVARATRTPRIDALVAQGTMIRGVLETAVQSDLPGMVRAVTTENVWSFDGRRVLIPSGSRLIGEYKSGLAEGQTRVFVVWTRLLRSDGVSVQLGSNGTDDLGRAGNAGFVDRHWVDRFGSAILLSLVGGASQFLGGYGQSDGAGTNTVITTTDPATGLITQTEAGGGQNRRGLEARQLATETTSQTMTSLAQEALKNSINIPPTIHLDQGTRIIVFVRRDLDFSAFYADPVKGALRELKEERAGGRDDGLPR